MKRTKEYIYISKRRWILQENETRNALKNELYNIHDEKEKKKNDERVIVIYILILLIIIL